MEIAIFGAGIAGLMTAVTLRSQGHSCRIYERTRQGHEAGMGFILMPEGIDCLQSYGVKLTGEYSGAPLYRYCCRNSAGQILYEQPLPAGARSMRRRDLLAALLRALPADGAPLFNAELAALEFDSEGKVTSARLNTGEEITADLFVSAEGIHSRARQAMFPEWASAQAQVLEIVGLVRCPDTVRWAGHNFNKFHAPGGGIALGTLAVDAEHVIWYLQFDSWRYPPPAEDGPNPAEERRDFVKGLVGDWAEPVPHLVRITDFSRTHFWRPLDTDVVPRFHQRNLVLVGDAAHPLSPFTSQGVSSAVADAVALSQLLKSEANLEAALTRYSHIRREQVAPYLAKGRELTRHFLSPQIGSTILLPIAESEHLETSPFSDGIVRLDLLRERAFNLRWAQQPPDVIPLTAADPDFPISQAIQDQLVRYIRDGVLSYGPPEGLPQFRDAVAAWMRSTRQMDCTAEQVFATDSAASGMAVLARASLNPGDEVLIPDPVDFLLHHTVQRAGAVPVRVSVNRATTAEEFIAGTEARLTPRTRMLWLCNPHNPLGVVYSREWLEKVSQWALSRGLRIVSDEIWSDIVYSPHRHVSVASLGPEIARNTVTVYGFSKNFALAGLRVGCLICFDPEWKKQIVAASDAESTVYGVSVLSQVAVIAALNEGREWLAGFVKHLQTQRDYVLERLSRWPGAAAQPPQGTYVVFPDVHALTGDSEQFCRDLLERARVALVPGAPRWFGPGAGGHVRICFATSHRILEEAFDRMEPVVLKLAEEAQFQKAVHS
ncbi:MAG TPA: aminotransferase class I/II-fold pyridoxal phosphate-dependent enzyme [Candidatus Angelobacter sp.]|nr:aminotransferase class I/II-fold pyridoxal phosphate-dependent enzyme [Candidatus Angelobacter sp.]